MNWYIKIAQSANKGPYTFKVPSEQIAKQISDVGQSAGFKSVQSSGEYVTIDPSAVLNAYINDKNKYNDFFDILFRYNGQMYNLVYSIERKMKEFMRAKKRTRRQVMDYLNKNVNESIQNFLSGASSFLQSI